MIIRAILCFQIPVYAVVWPCSGKQQPLVSYFVQQTGPDHGKRLYSHQVATWEGNVRWKPIWLIPILFSERLFFFYF